MRPALNEVRMGAANGLGRNEIYYSAPGKTDEDIRGAIRNAVLVADSLDEVERINRIAGEEGSSVPVGVRVNPDFSFHGSGGHPSKFGIDTVQALDAVPAWKGCGNIRVADIHVHLRSQELDAEILAGYYRRMFQLADEFQTALGQELDFINMGAGMGRQDTQLDTESLGKAVREMLSSFCAKFKRAKVFIETGRYAVGKAGFEGFIRAERFSAVREYSDAEREQAPEDYLEYTVAAAAVSKTDCVLEVAAGTCATGRAMAPYAASVTRLDVAPALILLFPALHSTISRIYGSLSGRWRVCFGRRESWR